MTERKTYDLHRHLWPEQLLDALRERSEPPCLRGWRLVLADGEYEIEPDGYGLERCLAELERDGIDVAVVSCPPTLGIDDLAEDEAAPLREAYHEGMLELAGTSDGRVQPLAMDRPRNGFVGVGISAAALQDLDGIASVLDDLDRRGGILFVHPGPAKPPWGAPPWWTACVGYTAQMQSAYAAWLADGIDRWPNLHVVFAILAGGAPIQLERLRSRGFDVHRALHPTVYLDTASYGPRALELCLSALGGGRIVFGSDAPVIDPRPTLAAVRHFGQAVAEAVCADNPSELLPWL